MEKKKKMQLIATTVKVRIRLEHFDNISLCFNSYDYIITLKALMTVLQ